MNKRQALGALAGDLLTKLRQMREHDERYGSYHAERGTADHERMMLAHEELEWRLAKIESPTLRRKTKAPPPDPNQVALFE
jgi:hypothetical protein